jgi:hypothetical protein
MKKEKLKKIYRYNQESNHFEIEISLDSYRELFNDWDGSPLRKKDLHPEFVDYLEGVAEDIPTKYSVDIIFVMFHIKKDDSLETASKQVFKNYFNYLININKRLITKAIRKALLYFLLGFTLLATAVYFKGQSVLSSEIFFEGVFIGGWVFLWEAVSLSFFRTFELIIKNKRHSRFTQSEIYYIYKP